MNGIINVYKESGMSSFDVIRKLRKILHTKKIGHTGTLDPLACGVLVICIGKATKLVSDIEAKEKVYVAEMQLGSSTDTYDSEGKIIKESENINYNEEEFLKVLKSFVGEIEQVPPMYSAIKIDGKKLYELARKGIEVERKARKVKIDYIKFLGKVENKIKIETKVSKGTYIRSLINDIGEKTGFFAHMTYLERDSVGEYKKEQAYTLSEIENMNENGNFSFLKNVEEIFDYNKINIEDDREYNLFINGNTIIKNVNDGIYRVYYNDIFLGLGNSVSKKFKFYKYLFLEREN